MHGGSQESKAQERCGREENRSGSYGAGVTSAKKALWTPEVRDAAGGGLVSEPTAHSHSTEACVQPVSDTNGGFVHSFK